MYVCMYIYIYIYMYICMYMYVYVCMYFYFDLENSVGGVVDDLDEHVALLQASALLARVRELRC